MNSKRRTGYGVFDLSRQVARRVQKEWEMVETPRPPMRVTLEAFPTLPPRNDQANTLKRRLAA